MGLSNLGNTCYANSMLQCMSHVPDLSAFFLSGVWRKYVNNANKLGTGGQAAQAYTTLLEQLWNGQHRWVDTSAFRGTFSGLAPQFSGSMQHDAEEFLNTLLDKLHEDLNQGSALRRSDSGKLYALSAESEPQDSTLMSSSTPAATVKSRRRSRGNSSGPATNSTSVTAAADRSELATQASAAWSSFVSRNRSVVVDKFAGQMRGTTQCASCKHTSSSFDSFQVLNLSIPHVKHTVTVQVVWELSLPLALARYELQEADVALSKALTRATDLGKRLKTAQARARGSRQSSRGGELRGAATPAEAPGSHAAAATSSGSSSSSSSELAAELDQARQDVKVHKAARDRAGAAFQEAEALARDMRAGAVEQKLAAQRARRQQDSRASAAEATAHSAALFDAQLVPAGNWAVKLVLHVPPYTGAEEVVAVAKQALALQNDARTELFAVQHGAPVKCLRGASPVTRYSELLLHVFSFAHPHQESLKMHGSGDIAHPRQLPLEPAGSVKFQYLPLMHRVRRMHKRHSSVHDVQMVLRRYADKLDQWAKEAEGGTGKPPPLPTVPVLQGHVPHTGMLETIGMPYVMRVFPHTTSKDVAATALQWAHVCWEHGQWDDSALHPPGAQPPFSAPAPWAAHTPELAGTDAFGRQEGEFLQPSHSRMACTGTSAAGHPVLFHPGVCIDWGHGKQDDALLSAMRDKAVEEAVAAAGAAASTPGDIRRLVSQRLQQQVSPGHAAAAGIEACQQLAEAHGVAHEALVDVYTMPPLDGFIGRVRAEDLGARCGHISLLEDAEVRAEVDNADDAPTGMAAVQAAAEHCGWKLIAEDAAPQHDGFVSLSECLQSFSAPERLGAGSAWECPACSVKTRAWKGLRLWRAPEVLVILLKRFRYDDYGNATKIDSLVDFPLEGLDLSEHLDEGPVEGGPEPVYDLFAVCNHVGSLAGGHYTALARNPLSGDWYEFNDHHVTRVGARVGQPQTPLQDHIVSSMAYVLLYRRRNSAVSSEAALRQVLPGIVPEGEARKALPALPSSAMGNGTAHEVEGGLTLPDSSNKD